MMEINLLLIVKVIFVALSLFPSNVSSGEFISNEEGRLTILQFEIKQQETEYPEAGGDYYITEKGDKSGEAIKIAFVDNGLYKCSFLSVDSDESFDLDMVDVVDIFMGLYECKDKIGKEKVTITTSEEYEIVISPEEDKIIISSPELDFFISVETEKVNSK